MPLRSGSHSHARLSSLTLPSFVPRSNIGGLHDDVGKLQRRVQTVSVDLSGESEAVKSRVAELEEQLTARQAQIETLHSQLATLTEKQEEQATVQQQMREQAEALQKEREEEAERLRQQQELEEQQRSRRRGGGRGRGRKTSKLGSTSATTGPRGETKNNGRPHTSNGRLAGGAMSAGGERNRTHSPQRPQTAANQMDNMVIGTKVNPTAARNNNNNNNANDGDGDDGEWGEDGACVRACVRESIWLPFPCSTPTTAAARKNEMRRIDRSRVSISHHHHHHRACVRHTLTPCQQLNA